MIFCTRCGNSNAENVIRCENCGASLVEEVEFKQTKIQAPKAEFVHPDFIPEKYEGQIPQRNYWYYLLPSILSAFIVFYGITQVITGGNEDRIGFILIIGFIGALFGGIVMYIYYFHNFNDFKKLLNKYHYATHPLPHSPWMMIALTFMSSPIMTFFKYNQLHEHFKYHHPEEEVPAHPFKVLGIMFAPLLLIPIIILLSIVTGPEIWLLFVAANLLSPFIVIYFESNWQKIFNEHVTNHEILGRQVSIA